MIDFNFEAVIFDLGGVLFDLNYQLTIDAFENLGMKNFKAIYSQAQQNQLFDEFEKGNVSADLFRNFFRENVSNQLTDKAIDDAWNAMLLGMKPFKFQTLQQVKKHVPIFLLSNTNAIHLPKVVQMIADKNDGITLENVFHKTYYSNKIHQRKPDAAAFEIVLQENNLNPSTTLFLDDSIQHIEGAKKIGIQAIHITSEITTEKIFEKWL